MAAWNRLEEEGLGEGECEQMVSGWLMESEGRGRVAPEYMVHDTHGPSTLPKDGHSVRVPAEATNVVPVVKSLYRIS